MSSIGYFDTETCCFPEDLEEEQNIMIQLAVAFKEGSTMDFFDDLNRNTIPIKAKASKIHHITEEDLVGKPDYDETSTYRVLQKEVKSGNLEYLIAHNIKFDAEVLRLAGLDISGVKQIDTFKVLKYINDTQGLIYEELNLQYMMYHLKLYKLRADVYAKYDLDIRNAHDALFDVVDLILLTAYIIKKFDTSYAEMHEITKYPLELVHMTNGRYRGQRLDSLSESVLKWNAENNFDDDIKYSCKMILEGE